MDQGSKLHVALLCGGISSERTVSLESGRLVYEALDRAKYDVTRYDPKTDLARLMADAPAIDIALIILHGPFGEDGTIQGFLDLLDIPYQGSGVLGSALAMNKLASKQIYESAGIKSAEYTVFTRDNLSGENALTANIEFPLVIKPAKGGSSIGMSIAKSTKTLKESVCKALQYDTTVLAETYIEGVELTCGVIGNDPNLETLPIVEIVPGKKHDFFDYEAKYKSDATQEICPARIDEKIAKIIQKNAILAHKRLFCRGYSRSDFILKDREVYILETNTIPGMTPHSLLPISAKAAGISFSELLDKLIKLGIEEASVRKKQITS